MPLAATDPSPLGEHSPKPRRDGRIVGAHADRVGGTGCDETKHVALRCTGTQEFRRKGTRGAELRRRKDTLVAGRVSDLRRPVGEGTDATPAYRSRRDQAPLLVVFTPTHVATAGSCLPFPLLVAVVAPRRRAGEPSSHAGTAWTAVFVRSFCDRLGGRVARTTHVRRMRSQTTSSHRESCDESRREAQRRRVGDVLGSAKEVVRGAGDERGPQARTRERKGRWKQHLQVLVSKQHAKKKKTHVHVWCVTSVWWIESQGRTSCKHPAATRWTWRSARGTSAP